MRRTSLLPRSGKPSCRGVTLPELLVGLTVLSILIVIAVPSFSGLIAAQRARNASLDLSTAITLARSEAVKQNTTATVSSTGDWTAGWALAVGSTVIRTFGPYTGVTIAPSNGNTLSIGNDGRPTAGGVTFLVTPTTSAQTSSTICVQVGGTGRVALVTGGCT
ncbi:prepilin-type N-terminal cleavage/methylation domain-containing protein [Ralstonia solanacearum]|uniref:GspH/FimT family pseudopilin n=1 Tax=Ralstonia solanacearum TaxID=305 RepID=UPI0002E7595D|nr:GspH/FimT family pseudopilin [Ralstonia solanacearum]MDC6179959.1 GspH/FimT family pseudopilin [Ralstonia solanacearum]MDC6212567.1 GspH/FimT family pseudopilin [Ralstonia solanacearum]MDC6238434.1 GspH/FimT family pseudopilin [Ralstonia solanacearum]MDD7803152.1 GspH/FimT family pseudopilin [Ralstonia solanacearum]TYZ54510.1 prepilin-type N-terminal cleavage/methylation domain-containing protein [Ralstonia solanacearum]